MGDPAVPRPPNRIDAAEDNWLRLRAAALDGSLRIVRSGMKPAAGEKRGSIPDQALIGLSCPRVGVVDGLEIERERPPGAAVIARPSQQKP